jgi:hypothetical protein
MNFQPPAAGREVPNPNFQIPRNIQISMSNWVVTPAASLQFVVCLELEISASALLMAVLLLDLMQ